MQSNNATTTQGVLKVQKNGNALEGTRKQVLYREDGINIHTCSKDRECMWIER